ncbi:hypothetical protein GNF10_36125 [Nostoc sp. UCD121]|uniref:hypothetical protein n=1 Tax=unclassified Nostoc TaxID=2593658 RepID=UPI001629D5A7|nr:MULTISPECIES: hypothetical protein [unclassified Nostoc]MBC1225393.1 hypothetical protein [Nostoc sp. UCD120]MBC1281207.1 hypothetical protein [Nostoc sp. UCD121]MBC1300205.1 hypothetical protein [Nostoc sp. UCD122]
MVHRINSLILSDTLSVAPLILQNSDRDTSGCTGEEFLTVIKGCDRSTLAGKRDYALLLLLWGQCFEEK